ncbi:hypothetical protein O988_06306 [Pseudogymnoascus sp. VKM F-3808]|nr:hypothetical protein O988_06306 [Pseudogymnoascus sp. VKM F-3808]
MPSPTTHTLSSPGKLQSWDEDRTITTTPRVTPASVKFALPELSSSLHSSYLMTYLPSGDASFIFTDVITSSAPAEQSKGFLGQEGSFVTQGKGTFEAKSYTVQGQFEIVEGTGTGGLQGIQGSGVFRSKPTETDKGSVEYSFEVKLPQ